MVKAVRALLNLPKIAWITWRWQPLRGNWLPGYLLHHRAFKKDRIQADTPIDIMILVVDHFEPAQSHGPRAAAESVRSWCSDYEGIADRYRDCNGRPFQHTWFYRAEYKNLECIQILSESVFRGFGEIEFHLHHGHDNHETFVAKLREGIAWFQQVGAMLSAQAEPSSRYGYIAGNWALDNGAGDDSLSGCNTELRGLRETGCYADFTFPALRSWAQPRKSNSLYYATEDPGPKSYDWGTDLKVGQPPSGDLLIFQGPLIIDWQRGCFEDGALETYAPLSADRLPAWLSANVHVAGRPEWIFIKLHTHGMQSRNAFLGPKLTSLLEAMLEQWSTPPFRLHFVTAREAFNIVRAAEAGHQGDPDFYRDFEVARPANRWIQCNAPWLLESFGPDRVHLKTLTSERVCTQFAVGPLRSIEGMIRSVDMNFRDNSLTGLVIEGEGTFTVDPRARLPGISKDKPMSREALDRLIPTLVEARR
jgi:hypothetical protein